MPRSKIDGVRLTSAQVDMTSADTPVVRVKAYLMAGKNACAHIEYVLTEDESRGPFVDAMKAAEEELLRNKLLFEQEAETPQEEEEPKTIVAKRDVVRDAF